MHDEHDVGDVLHAGRTWTVVVPVKEARHGKTRLSAAVSPTDRAALVRAMALDTVEAAVACDRVARVLVVTGDVRIAAAVAQLDAVTVVPEPTHAGRRSGLDAAALAGVAAARTGGPAAVAVLLGDLPALQPTDLSAALTAADGVARGIVSDTAGTGTTLLTVGPETPLDPRFGAGSAAAHRRLGHALLGVTDRSTLHRDVDVWADLQAAATLPLGPRTAALVGRWPGFA